MEQRHREIKTVYQGVGYEPIVSIHMANGRDTLKALEYFVRQTTGLKRGIKASYVMACSHT